MADDKASSDPFDLGRFLAAQEGAYERALGELKGGRKKSHWMWYIFPQIEGLGTSAYSRNYSIKSLGEARSYLSHPILGPRLRECCEALMQLQGLSASAVFGFPDDVKLNSSMTLFSVAAGPASIFQKVLEKYFSGERDDKTLEILKRLGGEDRGSSFF